MRILRVLAFGVLIFTATALFKPDSTEHKEIYESLDSLAEIFTIAQKHSPNKVEGDELVEGAVGALLEQLDPHSNYYNRNRYQTMREDQKGSFYGIGIMVGYQNNRLTVISPLEGTPASKAGVRAGDVISKIDQTNTEEMDLYEAIRLLRGREGSTVTVTILRASVDEPLDFNLERAEIPSSNVRSYFMLDEKTGYVALKDFGETAADEVRDAVLALSGNKMTQLVLDLRGNPGGLLPQAIKVAGLFLPGKMPIVSTQGRLRNANQEYVSEASSPLKQIPLIVLIDRGSASASEIVAGAIQDHDRGLILGVNSWGKGLVQSVFPLADGSRGLALTTSRYYTPSGRNIQGRYDSLENYYNPKSSEDLYFKPAAEDDHQVFKTAHGREVREVRGITPDVYIAFKETPAAVQELEAKDGSFFDFAALHQDDYPIESSDWVVSDQILDRYKDYLAEKKVEFDAFEEHKEIIRQKLSYQFLYIKNTRWAWKYLMLHDHQVTAALGLSDKAHELFRIFKGEGDLREEYQRELVNYALLHSPKKASR